MERIPHQPSLPGADPEYISCMSEEAMRQFVDDFVSGRIFTSLHVRNPEDVPMSFMVLMFMSWSDTGLKQIAVVWEYLDKAGPMSVNGMPTFFSCHFVNVDDWKILQPAIEKERKRREDIEL